MLGNLRVPPGGHRRYVLDTYLQLVHERSLGRFRTLRIRQRRGTPDRTRTFGGRLIPNQPMMAGAGAGSSLCDVRCGARRWCCR